MAADMTGMLRVRAALTTCQMSRTRYLAERSDLVRAIREVPELRTLVKVPYGMTEDQWLEALYRATQEHLPDVQTR